MKRMRKFPVLFLVIIAFILLCDVTLNCAQQVGQTEQKIVDQPEKVPETIIAGPKDIKESTGIYVFVAWMWLSILVLIYILRLKIKEVDRLFRLKFFSTEKE